MTIYYTAGAAFGKNSDEYNVGWEGYSEWQNRQEYNEVVTLDGYLNYSLIDIGDLKSSEDWEHVVSDGDRLTGFFSNLDFVVNRVKNEKYNLLAVSIDPDEACENFPLDNFEFVGYDLLDDWYSISSLTNCNGFVESYSLADINEFGLFSEWQKAVEARHNLLKNNPEDPHADTHVIAVWRHKVIGR